MTIDYAIEELNKLKNEGHGGYFGVQALALGIEALKEIKMERANQRYSIGLLKGESIA